MGVEEPFWVTIRGTRWLSSQKHPTSHLKLQRGEPLDRPGRPITSQRTSQLDTRGVGGPGRRERRLLDTNRLSRTRNIHPYILPSDFKRNSNVEIVYLLWKSPQTNLFFFLPETEFPGEDGVIGSDWGSDYVQRHMYANTLTGLRLFSFPSKYVSLGSAAAIMQS